jgi:acetylglutamate kinase
MKPIVVKIGGSTLGNADTTLEDLVTLQRQGISLVVVHGGAQKVSDWLSQLNISTGFINGLRVTDAETLKVVAAILAGLVNKELIAGIQALGGKAVGISGSDGNLIQAKAIPELGYAGEIVKVNPSLLEVLFGAGYMPVVAPISFGFIEDKATLLNVNGDAAAAEIAAALAAEKLIFLSDVDGIHDKEGKAMPRLNVAAAKALLNSGVATGGMIPKLEASSRALTTVPIVRIIDGRMSHALLSEMNSGQGGTTIVPE